MLAQQPRECGLAAGAQLGQQDLLLAHHLGRFHGRGNITEGLIHALDAGGGREVSSRSLTPARGIW